LNIEGLAYHQLLPDSLFAVFPELVPLKEDRRIYKLKVTMANLFAMAV